MHLTASDQNAIHVVGMVMLTLLLITRTENVKSALIEAYFPAAAAAPRLSHNQVIWIGMGWDGRRRI